MIEHMLWIFMVMAGIGYWLIYSEIINIRMKVSELGVILDGVSASLTAVQEQLIKATDEILAAVTDAELPAEVVAKIESIKTMGDVLKAAAQKLDDINPDNPPPPDPPVG